MLSRDDDIHDVGPDIHTCPDRDRRCVDSCVEMKLSNRAYNQDYNFYQKFYQKNHQKYAFYVLKIFIYFLTGCFRQFLTKILQGQICEGLIPRIFPKIHPNYGFHDKFRARLKYLNLD